MNDEQKKLLQEKLNPAYIKKRRIGNTELDYIEAWQAIDEANKVFDFNGWTRETILLEKVSEEKKTNKYNKELHYIGYIAQVRVKALGVVREGTGAGVGIDADLATAYESAVKEAESDAMKRALMTFGYRFGLALYDKAKENVAAPEKKQNEMLDEQNQQAIFLNNLAKENAQRGIDTYKNFFNNLTNQERNVIINNHENYKKIASGVKND